MRDFNAHAHKATGGAFSEFFEGFFVVVLRMRIKACDHADDGVIDEFFLIDGFDVVAFDHAENRSKLLQLFQRQRRHIGARSGLN